MKIKIHLFIRFLLFSFNNFIDLTRDTFLLKKYEKFKRVYVSLKYEFKAY